MSFAFIAHNDNLNDHIAHVINVETDTHVSNVHLPVTPVQIKDGYAYRTAKDEEGFYIVEKYRINPAVYGK